MAAENTGRQADAPDTGGGQPIEILEPVEGIPADAVQPPPDQKPPAKPEEKKPADPPAKDKEGEDEDFELIEDPSELKKDAKPEAPPKEDPPQKREELPVEVRKYLQQAQVFESHINDYLTDPDNRRNYLKWRKERGFPMQPDWEREITEAPAKGQPQELKSEDEIMVEARKLQDAGKDLEASRLISSFFAEKNKRALDDVKRELNQSKEERHREREESLQREVDHVEDVAWGSLAERFPKLFHPNPRSPIRVSILDDEFGKAFLENVKAAPHGDLVQIARGTLIQLGRVRPKRGKAVQSQVPHGAPAVSPAPQKQKGMQQIEILEPSDGIFRTV